jgi:hypothetical protein
VKSVSARPIDLPETKPRSAQRIRPENAQGAGEAGLAGLVWLHFGPSVSESEPGEPQRQLAVAVGRGSCGATEWAEREVSSSALLIRGSTGD